MIQFKDYHLLDLFLQIQRGHRKELVYTLIRNVLFLLQQESKQMLASTSFHK